MDDPLTVMSDFNEAKTFLDKTNSCHENLKFTLEVAEHNTISFGGMNITKRGKRLETSVHRKSTNTSVLLLYHSLWGMSKNDIKTVCSLL